RFVAEDHILLRDLRLTMLLHSADGARRIFVAQCGRPPDHQDGHDDHRKHGESDENISFVACTHIGLPFLSRSGPGVTTQYQRRLEKLVRSQSRVTGAVATSRPETERRTFVLPNASGRRRRMIVTGFFPGPNVTAAASCAASGAGDASSRTKRPASQETAIGAAGETTG